MIHTRPGTTDALVVHQIFVEELYRPAMGLRDYALIIDGGANIGAASLYFARHYPKALIEAVEPSPDNFDVLTKNVSAVAQCTLAGLWSHHASAVMMDHGTGAWALTVKESDDGGIPLWPLNPFLGDRPCLVKLDIEGAELEVFRHPSWLQHVDVLAVENHSLAAATAMLAAVRGDGRKFRWWDVGETSFVEFT